jgi:hypothetical protein
MTDPVLSVKTANGRYYTHPGRGKQVPSVTNIKDMRNIPALKYWAAKQAANYAADNRIKLAALEREEVFQLVKSAPFAATSAGRESALVGDIVHEWADRIVKGDSGFDTDSYTDKRTGEVLPSPLQAKQMWRQFQGFVDKYHPKWVAGEFTVWSDKYGYAGTADWSAYIGTALVLGDNKTGTGVYPDTAMQLAALGNADFILDADGTEHELPRFDRFAISHIRPRFSRLIPVEHTDEWFKAFLGLKTLFDCVIEWEDSTLQYAPKIEVRAA